MRIASSGREQRIALADALRTSDLAAQEPAELITLLAVLLRGHLVERFDPACVPTCADLFDPEGRLRTDGADEEIVDWARRLAAFTVRNSPAVSDTALALLCEWLGVDASDDATPACEAIDD